MQKNALRTLYENFGSGVTPNLLDMERPKTTTAAPTRAHLIVSSDLPVLAVVFSRNNRILFSRALKDSGRKANLLGKESCYPEDTTGN